MRQTAAIPGRLPPDPLVYVMHHTILVIVTSRKGQILTLRWRSLRQRQVITRLWATQAGRKTKGGLTRAQTTRSETISCGGQARLA